MSEAYIFCPDVITDAIDNKSPNHLFTITLISFLHNEWIKPCTITSKKYLGFVSDYHKSKMIGMCIKLLAEEEITEEELYTLNIILSSLQEQGLIFNYEDEYSPIFDLAKQLRDSFDVYIVCNNGKAMEMQRTIGSDFAIINSEIAFLNVLDDEDEE